MQARQIIIDGFVCGADIASFGSNEDNMGYWRWPLMIVGHGGLDPIDGCGITGGPMRTVRLDPRMPNIYGEEEKIRRERDSNPCPCVFGQEPSLDERKVGSTPLKEVEWLTGDYYEGVSRALSDEISKLRAPVDNDEKVNWLVVTNLACEFEGCAPNFVLTDKTNCITLRASVNDFLARNSVGNFEAKAELAVDAVEEFLTCKTL